MKYIPEKKSLIIFVLGFLIGVFFPQITDATKYVYQEMLFNPERGGYTVVIKSENIGFLKRGDAVAYNDINIGRVKDVGFIGNDATVGAICVIQKNIKIEKTTIGQICSYSFSGEHQYVSLRRMPRKIEDKIHPKYLSNNDTILAQYQGGIYDWIMRDSVNFFQKIDIIYQKSIQSNLEQEKPSAR